MIRLEKIDARNIWDFVDLEVAKEQESFVAPNDISIAQAYTAVGTECRAFSFGIRNDDEPENEVAKKLYRSFGFEENGEMDGDEIVAVLKL